MSRSPSDALHNLESKYMPFKVYSLVDGDGVVWWRVDDGKGKWSDLFTCSIGDRTMHIDELVMG